MNDLNRLSDFVVGVVFWGQRWGKVRKVHNVARSRVSWEGLMGSWPRVSMTLFAHGRQGHLAPRPAMPANRRGQPKPAEPLGSAPEVCEVDGVTKPASNGSNWANTGENARGKTVPLGPVCLRCNDCWITRLSCMFNPFNIS